MAALALAWLLRHRRASTRSIVGPRRPEHLEPARRGARARTSSDADIFEISRAVRSLARSGGMSVRVLSDDDVRACPADGRLHRGDGRRARATSPPATVRLPLRSVVRPPRVAGPDGPDDGAPRRRARRCTRSRRSAIFPENPKRGTRRPPGRRDALRRRDRRAARPRRRLGDHGDPHRRGHRRRHARARARRAPSTLAVLGAGVQARAHIEAHGLRAAARAGARLSSRTPSHAQALAAETAPRYVPGRGGADRVGRGRRCARPTSS